MLKDITGQKFGRLTVISKNDRPGHLTYWNCVCDCGNTAVIAGSRLKNGNTKSCGCLHDESSRKRAKMQFTKHGMCHTRLSSIWSSMKTRCSNPNARAYKWYGARGITFCDDWNEFEPFMEWALANGYSDNLTLERIDVNGNYEPENCKWIPFSEQGKNTRKNHFVTIKGETHCVSEWSKIIGINRSSFRERLQKGWSEEDLLKPPCHTKDTQTRLST